MSRGILTNNQMKAAEQIKLTPARNGSGTQNKSVTIDKAW
jgi:hypothetical protein